MKQLAPAESTDAKLARMIEKTQERVKFLEGNSYWKWLQNDRSDYLSLLLLVQTMGKALEKLWSYNESILKEEINYSPNDNMEVAEIALLARYKTIKELK